MFDGIVEVNNKKIRIIFPHKCGSGTFSNLIRDTLMFTVWKTKKKFL